MRQAACLGYELGFGGLGLRRLLGMRHVDEQGLWLSDAVAGGLPKRSRMPQLGGCMSDQLQARRLSSAVTVSSGRGFAG